MSYSLIRKIRKAIKEHNGLSVWGLPKTLHSIIDEASQDVGIIYIINGSLGTKYYDAGFFTHKESARDYRREGGEITSFSVLEGIYQHLNPEYV